MTLRSILPAFLALALACSAPIAPTDSQPQRIVAFADLHGDFDATRRALLLAGAIDEDNHWIGGEMIVVQTGDMLDRGDGEQAILELFEDLAVEANAAGGELHVLLGNHELMNVAGDFRYVTPGGYADFEDALEYDPDDPALAKFEPHQRARARAFLPGGPFALKLANYNVVLVLGDNVFVHGGLLPMHIEYGIDRMNRETKAWLRGESEAPEFLRGSKSPVWLRLYSRDADEDAARTLHETLALIPAKRLLMGHTVQKNGIQFVCDGAAYCLDVGMASHYGGSVEVLQIIGDEVTILK